MSSDDLKSSANIWDDGNHTQARQGSQSQPSDLPPAYTTTNVHPDAPPASSRNPRSPLQPQINPLQALSLLSSIDFSAYQFPSSTLSPDHTTLTTTHALYYTSPTALAKLITAQSLLPPLLHLSIKGTHLEYTRPDIIDFDLTLNLTTLLDINSGSTPHSNQLRLTPALNPSGPTDRAKPPTLNSICTQFCASQQPHTSLTLTRTIPSLAQHAATLEGRLRTLLSNLQYRGKVTISFPMHHSTLTVLKRPKNWLFNALGLYPVKEMQVGESIWQLRGEEDGGGSRVIDDWWMEWEGVIAEAAIRRHKGRLGVEEWMDFKMGRREKRMNVDWGVDG